MSRNINEPDSSSKLLEVSNLAVEFDTYGGTVQAVRGVSFEVERGRTLAIVGESGCGKTTSIKLVLRNYDVTKGELLIDGKNIKSLNLKSLHRQIGVVSQEPSLMKATLEENIAYGVDSYTQEELVAACKDANAYEFIMDRNKFPRGFQTKIDEGGGNLSGGQK